MFISLTIITALGLGWLAKILIKRYPHSPHPRRFEKFIGPLVRLAENLIKKIKTKITSLR